MYAAHPSCSAMLGVSYLIGSDLMAKYRAKPVDIEATLFFALGDHPAVKQAKDVAKPTFIVESMQGVVEVFPGDWIISETVEGKFYPCAPAEFARKYEYVPDAQCLQAMKLTMLPVPDSCPRCGDGPCVAGAAPGNKLGEAIKSFVDMGFTDKQAMDLLQQSLVELKSKGTA